MCIAIMNPSNVTLKKNIIRTCWDNNYHGGGLLYINSKTKQLESFKSLTDFDALYAKYQEVRKNHSKSKVVLHFRISTHGTISVENVHPFMVSKSLGFVHNGIISQAPYSKQYSDTYMFNETMLKKLPSDFLDNQAILDLLDDYIGYSKLLFLDSDNNHTIIGEEKGVWDHGCWFSNTGYKPSKYLDYGGTKVAKGTAYTPSAAATGIKGSVYTPTWRKDWDLTSNHIDDDDDLFADDTDVKELKQHTCDCCMTVSDNTYSGVQYSTKWDAFLCADCEWDLEEDEYYDEKAYNESFNADTLKAPF